MRKRFLLVITIVIFFICVFFCGTHSEAQKRESRKKTHPFNRLKNSEDFRRQKEAPEKKRSASTITCNAGNTVFISSCQELQNMVPTGTCYVLSNDIVSFTFFENATLKYLIYKHTFFSIFLDPCAVSICFLIQIKKIFNFFKL